MAEKLTMADIAELAGVTKSTVSRYFNGGSIKEETRKKIQNVVEENNYIPNSFARLKAKESNTVGVIVHSYSNALFKVLGKNYYRHRRIHKKLLMFLGKRNGTE